MAAETPNQNGDVVFSNQLYRIDMAIKGYGVKSGMAVTGGGAASMTVAVAAGFVWVNGVEIPYAGGSANISAADATYPRKDLISIDSAGAIQVTEGTPAAADPSGDTGPATFTPIPPALPSDETLLAEVWVAAGAVGIIDSNIHDMRVIAKTAYGAFDYGMSFEGTVSGIASAPKFECSNLTGYGNDYFVGYWAYVVWDAGGAGAAPQSEKKIITDYVSATGQFTVAAWTAPLAVGDKVLIVHPAIMGDIVVEVGEMSDTATAADLSDITTTSVHAKLRRALLYVKDIYDIVAHVTYGNSALKTLIDAITTKLAKPNADATTDATVAEAIGIKADAAQTTVGTTRSIMAYIKGVLNQLATLIGYHTVPAKDATTDAQMRDVIGKKDDTAVIEVGTTKSIMAYVKGAISLLVNGTYGLSALQTLLAAIPTTAMRGTDNAFLASVGGAVDTAAVYEVAADKTLMAYIKGLVASGIAAVGQVDDVAPSADDFDTTLTEATDDHYNGAKMTFISGALTGQSRYIMDYDGTAKNCDFSALSSWTEAPADEDWFVILPDNISPLAYLISNTASAAVLGALDTAAATGAVSDAKEVMAYIKQLVTAAIAVQAKTDLILPGTKFATKTSTANLTSGDLFTYTGTVGIISIIGRITTDIEDSAVTVKLIITPDALSAKDICAVKDIQDFITGTLLSITGTFADALVATDGEGCAPSQASMITATCVTSGKISTVFNPSADNSGVIVWEILWIPQTPGATLVAA